MSDEDVQTTALDTLQKFVEREFGIQDASPITLLAQMAWDASFPQQHRVRCAIALLPYCHQSIRASDMADPEKGPELLVQVLGPVSISKENQVVVGDTPALELVSDSSNSNT